MMDSKTPITDLVRDLLSQNVPRDTVVAACARLELALGAATTSSTPALSSRDKERLRKAEWRERTKKKGRDNARDNVPVDSSSNTENLFKDSEKEDSAVPHVPGQSGTTEPTDDWPEDFETLFWQNFPKRRRYEKPQVMAFLAKLRRDRAVTWGVLFDGVLRYANSDLGIDDQYAKAPLPWLRGQRWDGQYKPKSSAAQAPRGNGSRGRQSFGDIAAAAEDFLRGQGGPIDGR